MALPFVQEEPSPDFWQNHAGDVLPSSSWDVISSEFELAKESTGLMTIADMMATKTIDEMPGQKTLSVAELNEKYMGTGITWTEPKKEEVAEYIADAHKRRQVLQNRIYTAGGGGIAGFGANMAAHLMDPLEFGANILGGWAVSSAAAAPALLRSTTLTGALSRGAVEGAVTQLPFEALEIARNRQLEMDVSLSQSMANIALGGFVGAGIEGFGYGVGRYLESKRGANPTNHRMVESSASQILDGRFPDVKLFEDVFNRERTGIGPRPDTDFSGRSGYKFEPIDSSAPVSRKLYLGTSSRAEAFDNITPEQYKNSRGDFGSGIYLVDDPYVANGYAASTFNESPGLIHELDLSGAKLLSLGDAAYVPKNAAEAAIDLLPKSNDIAKRLNDGAPVHPARLYDALEAAGKTEEFNARLREQGYDGIHFVDGAEDGSARHNSVMIFPESRSKLKALNSIESDPKYLAGLKQGEIDESLGRYNSPDEKLFYSLDDARALRELERRSELPPLEDQALAEAKQEAMEIVNELDAAGALSPGEKAMLEDITGKSKQQGGVLAGYKKARSDGEGIIKAMFTCVGRS
jgi:hypothetical protein